MKELKPNKKQKRREKKVNIYKSTFNTINNVIFIAIICFDRREQLIYILLHLLLLLQQRFRFGFLIYCDSTFSFHLLGFLSIS